jgi:hypothetical protein
MYIAVLKLKGEAPVPIIPDLDPHVMPAQAGIHYHRGYDCISSLFSMDPGSGAGMTSRKIKLSNKEYYSSQITWPSCR